MLVRVSVVNHQRSGPSAEAERPPMMSGRRTAPVSFLGKTQDEMRSARHLSMQGPKPNGLVIVLSKMGNGVSMMRDGFDCSA